MTEMNIILMMMMMMMMMMICSVKWVIKKNISHFQAVTGGYSDRN